MKKAISLYLTFKLPEDEDMFTPKKNKFAENAHEKTTQDQYLRMQIFLNDVVNSRYA